MEIKKTIIYLKRVEGSQDDIEPQFMRIVAYGRQILNGDIPHGYNPCKEEEIGITDWPYKQTIYLVDPVPTFRALASQNAVVEYWEDQVKNADKQLGLARKENRDLENAIISEMSRAKQNHVVLGNKLFTCNSFSLYVRDCVVIE